MTRRRRRKRNNRLRLINSLRINENNNVSSDPSSTHALLRQSTKDLGPKFNPYMYIKQTMKTIPVDNRREVKRSSFEVGEQIGAGNFSNVCRLVYRSERERKESQRDCPQRSPRGNPRPGEQGGRSTCARNIYT